MTAGAAAAGRAIVLDATACFAPDADPEDRRLALGFAASLPRALGLRRDGAAIAAAPLATLARRATPLGPLRDWLVGAGRRPGAARFALPRRFSFAAAPRLPRGALVVVPGLAAWGGPLAELLARRPDLRPVAILGGPTGLDWPEYEQVRHLAAMHRGLAPLARIGGSVFLARNAGEVARAALARAGVASRPLVGVPLPSALAGTVPQPPDPALAAIAYVVVCGPIEARTNTLLLLQIWRDWMARGEPVPKLVLAGPRATQAEDIRTMIDWNETLRGAVVEAPNLSAASLRLLLRHARALLAPAFADGSGALLRDALALRVPVIAADNPAYRDVCGDAVLSPIDGRGWRDAIRAAAHIPTDPRRPSPMLPDWPDYVDAVLRAAVAAEHPTEAVPEHAR